MTVIVGAAPLPAQAGGRGSVGAKTPVTLDPDLPTGSSFGYSVAVSGDTALVGASKNDSGDLRDAGTAHIYVAADGTWDEQAVLAPMDPGKDDKFGSAVAVDGDTALIGAPYDNPDGVSDAGAAYVFVRSGTTWVQQAKLTPSEDSQSHVGWSVAIQGDTAVISAPAGFGSGRVFIFTRSGTTWTLQSTITNPNQRTYWFGNSVAIDGETLVVGQTDLNDIGSAYVFTGSGATWTQQAQLQAPDGRAGDGFGSAVAVDADTAVVGVPSDTTSVSYSGSAYVFARSGTTWSQQAFLSAEGPEQFDRFGESVAVAGNTAVIGASERDAVLIFCRTGTMWTQKREIDGPGSSDFGQSVDFEKIAGTRTLIVGADGSGTAYVYR